MKDAPKTIVFGALAVILCIIAAVTSPQKNVDALFVDLGTEFYPDFTDPLKATSLEVVGADKDTGILLPFKVELKDGRWSIPSASNYPADAKDKVAKLAANLVGITRDELRSDLPSDHEILEVVKPDAQTPTGKGVQVTLKDANGNILCDYILGKEVEGKFGWRYVRIPNQSKTFAVKMDIDLSTKFKDWVETGLLEMTNTDARKLEVMNYSVTQGQLVEKGRFDISKEDAGDWSTKNQIPEGKQLSQDKVGKVIDELSNLKLAGVRKKPDSLIELLSGNSRQLTPESQLSLQNKGFYLAQGGILGDEGQFILTKYNGIKYTVIFGVGFNDESLQVSTKKEGEAEKNADEKATGRYMFINVGYDDKFNTAPTIPAEPKVPAEDATEEVKKKYDEDLKTYNKAKADKEAWEKDSKEAKEEVAKLQKRFTDWYYVIDNESYEKIKVTFPDLVEDIPKPADDKAGAPPAGIPGQPTLPPGFPGLK
ncbi:MAG: DUF4340 domain-containing protein [Lentisphaerales bacterium]|nr:DUF4340 domain-containing protein [Lentisphaerales bacterium]